MKKSISVLGVSFFVIKILLILYKYNHPSNEYHSYKFNNPSESSVSSSPRVRRELNIENLRLRLSDISEEWIPISTENFVGNIYSDSILLSLGSDKMPTANFHVSVEKKNFSEKEYIKYLNSATESMKRELETMLSDAKSHDANARIFSFKKSKLKIGNYDADLISGKLEIDLSPLGNFFYNYRYLIYTNNKVFLISVNGIGEKATTMIDSWEKAVKY